MTFQKDGHQIFPALLSSSLISEVSESLLQILGCLNSGHPLWENVVKVSELNSARNPGVAESEIKNVPFIISELPRWSPVFHDFIVQADLWNAAREVLQSDSVVYHFSNVTRKPAHIGPNLAWHRDYPNQYICPENSGDFFRALIPLGAMNSTNGCTQVIPGTHLISDNRAQELKLSKERDFDKNLSVDLDAAAGDMIAIHSKIVHGGRENRSAQERDLVVIQFGKMTDKFLSKNQELFSGLSYTEISRRN